VLHGSVAALFIAAMLAHIYIGTIGMEGAFEGMGTGEVDENWAKQHHSLWLAQEQARTGPNQSQSQAQARAAATPAE
jgi:formate dehydrogenase subunit gamma